MFNGQEPTQRSKYEYKIIANNHIAPGIGLSHKIRNYEQNKNLIYDFSGFRH